MLNLDFFILFILFRKVILYNKNIKYKNRKDNVMKHSISLYVLSPIIGVMASAFLMDGFLVNCFGKLGKEHSNTFLFIGLICALAFGFGFVYLMEKNWSVGVG